MCHQRTILVLISTGLLAFITSSCGNQLNDRVLNHSRFGYPAGTSSKDQLIIYELYSSCMNPETKIADWVAYRIDKETISGKNRMRNWKADPYLDETLTLEPEDYKGAYKLIGMDRGHFAPLGSLDGDESWYETNYLSNISPQMSDLNRGPWRQLESFERELIEQGIVPFLHVITGPLYEIEMPMLPNSDESHQIPSGFWKILILPHKSRTHSFIILGFIFSQVDGYKDIFINKLVTVDDIESRSGLDFFVELDDNVESYIEKHYHIDYLKKLVSQ